MQDLLRSRASRVELDAEMHNNNFEDYTDSMKAYFRFLTEKTCANVNERILFERLAANSVQSALVESLILSRCDFKKVEEVFRLPEQSIRWYKELFFDTDNFLTDLDLISYLEECEDGKEMKVRAVDFGYEYILYTYGHVTPDDNMRAKLLQNICASTAYKALSMNFNTMTSSAGKQAAEYAKLMVKAFETLQRIPQESGLQADIVQYLTKTPPTELADGNIADEDIC